MMEPAGSVMISVGPHRVDFQIILMAQSSCLGKSAKDTAEVQHCTSRNGCTIAAS